MLRYLSHPQLDLQQWDACIESASNGLPYGLSWYLDIVSPQWEAIVREEGGVYTAVMPLPVARKFGLRYLKQPAFAQQLGVFERVPLTAAEWQELAGLLRRRFRFITRYEFNTSNTFVLENGLDGFGCRRFTTHHLALGPGYEAVKAGYKKGRRWKINKAHRSGLTMRESADLDALIRLFDENTAGRIYGVIGEDYEYRLLRQLYHAARQRNMAQLYEAVDEAGTVVAMILLFAYNHKLIYIFNASSTAGKSQDAISFLLDAVMRRHAGQPWWFDFESPEVANVAEFYASFGSENVPFASVTLNNLPAPVRWLKQTRTAVVRYLAGAAGKGQLPR